MTLEGTFQDEVLKTNTDSLVREGGDQKSQ